MEYCINEAFILLLPQIPLKYGNESATREKNEFFIIRSQLFCSPKWENKRKIVKLWNQIKFFILPNIYGSCLHNNAEIISIYQTSALAETESGINLPLYVDNIQAAFGVWSNFICNQIWNIDRELLKKIHYSFSDLFFGKFSSRKASFTIFTAPLLLFPRRWSHKLPRSSFSPFSGYEKLQIA